MLFFNTGFLDVDVFNASTFKRCAFVYKVVAGGKKAKKKYRPFYGEKNDARDNDTEMLRYVPSLPEIKCHVKHFATHVPYFALISIYRVV